MVTAQIWVQITMWLSLVPTVPPNGCDNSFLAAFAKLFQEDIHLKLSRENEYGQVVRLLYKVCSLETSRPYCTSQVLFTTSALFKAHLVFMTFSRLEP